MAPPELYRLVTDINASFKLKILILAQRQRITDIHLYREADNLRGLIEITEYIFIRKGYRQRLTASSRFTLTMPLAPLVQNACFTAAVITRHRIHFLRSRVWNSVPLCRCNERRLNARRQVGAKSTACLMGFRHPFYRQPWQTQPV
jgi:hypothetical protein